MRPLGWLLADDFPREASQGSSGGPCESQPGPPAHHPISPVLQFREMLKGAPIWVDCLPSQGSWNPEGHVHSKVQVQKNKGGLGRVREPRKCAAGHFGGNHRSNLCPERLVESWR